MYEDCKIKFIIQPRFEPDQEVEAEIFFDFIEPWDTNSYTSRTTIPGDCIRLERIFKRCDDDKTLGKIVIETDLKEY